MAGELKFKREHRATSSGIRSMNGRQGHYIECSCGASLYEQASGDPSADMKRLDQVWAIHKNDGMVEKPQIADDNETFTLDPSDPFDAALLDMAQLHRKKRADYAADEDRWSNFRTTASLLGMDGFGTQEAIEVNIAQKMARLQSLRLNGRMDDPKNESVLDTRLDLSIYAVLSYVYAKQGM